MGDLVHLSIRPEKIRISREKPDHHPHQNCLPGIVEDVVYMGDHTYFWTRVEGNRIAVNRPHRRFSLDEKPIKWDDEVWISWHADDGFMLERYSKADEKLIHSPPECKG